MRLHICITILTFRFISVRSCQLFWRSLKSLSVYSQSLFLKVKHFKCYRMFEHVIFLKTDSAVDIWQEIFHVLHKKKSFYEKLYLIFRISTQWLHQSPNFVISFYKKMKNFKKCITEQLKHGYLPIFFSKLLLHLRCHFIIIRTDYNEKIVISNKPLSLKVLCYLQSEKIWVVVLQN